MFQANPAHRKLKYCTNCETQLQQDENFCPDCGQKNLDRKVSFWVFVGDFIREELKLDNRVIRTFIPLLFRPGFLTLAFMEGRRKSYIRPIQLFLLIGFLCFFVLSLLIERADFSGFDKEAIETNGGPLYHEDESKNNLIQNYFKSHVEEAKDNPKTYIVNTLQKLPFVLLMVLPLFALFHKLIYFRHKIYFVEHLVFLLHTHAFLLFISFIAAILFLLEVKWFAAMISWIQFIYLFIAFKKVYQQGWIKTFIKLSFLFVVYILMVPILLSILGIIAGLI